jgi:hypothetical protein
MSENVTRLELAQERLDKVQALLDEARTVLNAAESARAGAERARRSLGKVNLIVLAGAVVVCIAIVVSRRGH